MARPGRREDQVEGEDEEFVFRLDAASELLAHGDAEGARTALERALELKPRDAKVLGLLGQAHYRLGRYEDAIVAWQRLVDENPAEPAARVNLGLAFLRAKRQSQATRQLEIALDLNPDHKKAMGYLGLALLESGDPLSAREWFVKAGSDQMVARCDRVLAGGASAPGQPTAPTEGGTADDDALPVDVDVEDIGLAPVAPAPEPAAPPAFGAEAPPWRAEVAPAPAAPPADIVRFAAARAVAAPESGTFAIAGALLTVRVRSAVRVRLSGMLGVRGTAEAEPEVKRFRGRLTEKPFGEGAAQLHRVQGDCSLVYATGKKRFTPLKLVDAAFFREEAVFGFEDSVVFENGRVPSASAGELNLVHARGQGVVLVTSAAEPVVLQVAPEVPLRLPVEALVGWIGALTPRLVGLIEGAAVEVLGVELSGEGRVIADPGAIEPASTEAAGSER